MADITCEVIRDLMPLYVDDVLSSDSKTLVEEHLETCEDCTDYYHALKEPEGDYKQMRKSDEKAAFKRIKGTLKKKRLITILVTAVCIAALGFGLFYGRRNGGYCRTTFCSPHLLCCRSDADYGCCGLCCSTFPCVFGYGLRSTGYPLFHRTYPPPDTHLSGVTGYGSWREFLQCHVV